ncbi:T-complex protein 11-domain-containing protein [Powellomyces hirtus]|nr:T-complex protein 11-domain-containing protein [Powellomyces hirtus]
MRRKSLSTSQSAVPGQQQQANFTNLSSAIPAAPLQSTGAQSATSTSPPSPPPTSNLRKSKSLSFFVDLMSPMSTFFDAPPSPTAPSQSHDERPQSPTKRARRAEDDDDSSKQHPSPAAAVLLPSPPPSFPPFVRNRGSSAELYRRMTQRLMRAQALREGVLYDRRARLRRRFEQIRYRILLQRQRDRLTSLKIQARSEYAISAANLKRQLILKKNMDRCGAAVEHAQTVAMAQRLRKFMELRRSFSENFVELLAESQSLGGGGADVMQAMGLGIHRQLSMVDIDDTSMLQDEEYEVDAMPFHIPASPTFSHASPSSCDRSRHVDLAALRSSGVTGVVEGNSNGSVNEDIIITEDMRAKFAERRHPSGGAQLANDAGGATSTSPSVSETAGHEQGILSSLDHDGEDMIGRGSSESLAATVRRLRVLPVSILEEMEESDYLQLLSLLPPITRFTLRELELTEILSNAQLRHDLYFDPELQFKPNLDGEKGDQKKDAGDAYWMEVEAEVAQGHLYRLPLLLFEIRSIIIELLPYSQERREEVDRNLDIQLVAQQIDHGVLNAVGLVTYLADLLKANCAPARDELVDAMVEECRGGNVVKTLRQCFEVLELMKLDYANHQLHRVRPYVVEHAAEFEWRWFKDQYEADAIKLDDTMRWVQLALVRHNTTTASTAKAAGPSATTATASSSVPSSLASSTHSSQINIQHLHTKALLHLISQSHLLSLPTPPIPLPETLRMDVSRLVQYYNDWQDVTIMAALLVLFKQSCAPKACKPDQLDSIKRVLWVLLNDHETSMTHVTLQMCKTAGDIRGKPFSAQETTMLTNLVESTLQPESKLYEIIRARVGTVVERLVLAGPVIPTTASSTANTPDSSHPPTLPAVSTAGVAPVSKADLAKVGLAELEEEVLELGDRVRRLVTHNWTVFAGVYAGVVDGLTQPSSDGETTNLERAMRE